MMLSSSVSHLIWPTKPDADVPGAPRGDEEESIEAERGGDEEDDFEVERGGDAENNSKVEGMVQLLLRYTIKEGTWA